MLRIIARIFHFWLNIRKKPSGFTLVIQCVTNHLQWGFCFLLSCLNWAHSPKENLSPPTLQSGNLSSPWIPTHCVPPNCLLAKTILALWAVTCQLQLSVKPAQSLTAIFFILQLSLCLSVLKPQTFILAAPPHGTLRVSTKGTGLPSELKNKNLAELILKS